MSSSNGTFSISPGTSTIDTNCTGCNATNSSGAAIEQFSATLTAGGAAGVTWKVSGGDANSGPGTISSSGQYVPPSYLTADHVSVTVTATLASDTSTTASTMLTVTPGFLQPLTPENAAVGANGTLAITGYIAEAGGSLGITYGLSSTASGSGGGQGTLSSMSCTRSTTALYLLQGHVHRARNRLRHQRHLCRGQRRQLFLADGQRNPAQHGRCLERSGESRSRACDAHRAGQLGRETTMPTTPRATRLWIVAAARSVRSFKTAAAPSTCSATITCWRAVTRPPRVKLSCNPASLTTTARPTGKPAQPSHR